MQRSRGLSSICDVGDDRLGASFSSVAEEGGGVICGPALLVKAKLSTGSSSDFHVVEDEATAASASPADGGAPAGRR